MKLHSIIPMGICVALILFFLSLVISNSVNVPNGDDLYCLLLFTQQFQDASTFSERLHLLTGQWVEHRIVYSRLAALVSYWLTSQVNFVTIILIGNATLVGFTVLFWKLIKKANVSLYYLIPVVLTLFSPVTYEANLWAGASTVYMPVAFLGLLTIYLLVYHGRTGMILAMLSALLATFSFGNGMFTFVAAIAVLLYQRKIKSAVIFGIAAVAAVFLYFQDFEAHSSTNAFGVAEHFKKPQYLAYNLFGFVGGILDYTENSNAPVVASNSLGLVLGLLLFVAICAGSVIFLREQPLGGERPGMRNLKIAWLGMAAFILMTAVIMAYSRTSGAAMNTLSSRYKIYSMLCWIMVYCLCLIHFNRKKVVGMVFGGVSLLILLFNYYNHYDKLTNYKSYLLSGLFNYTTNGQWLIYRHTAYYEGASKMLSDSIANSLEPVYAFNPVFNELSHSALNRAALLKNVRISEDTTIDGKFGKRLTIHTDDYPSSSNYFKGIYLVVYNDTNIYLFVANPAKNGRINMVTRGEYFKKGFYLDNDFGKTLKPGSQYKLAVFCPTEHEKIKRLDYHVEG
ncbi:hypothetical protein [Dyadobacter crusticola]|uniref:hypothetical protein n=1 Tax=Dyadobacter crusticola TaxID=292407 RepID=UPI0004E19C29|nr:hypothetical protein [Dyadobacter crusticola]